MRLFPLKTLAIYGKIEVSTATREMERKFEVLAGHALKASVLKIEYEDAELDRREIVLNVDASGVFQFRETLLHNVGDGTTDNVSIRLYFNRLVDDVGRPDSVGWQRSRSVEKELPSAFFWGGPFHVSPREKWVVEPFFGKASGELQWICAARCRCFMDKNGMPQPASPYG